MAQGNKLNKRLPKLPSITRGDLIEVSDQVTAYLHWATKKGLTTIHIYGPSKSGRRASDQASNQVVYNGIGKTHHTIKNAVTVSLEDF